MGKLDKLILSIDGDIAWRKKEVSKIILMHSEENSDVVVKSSVLLIYSHWEGCVKNLCKLYLSYVSSLSIGISELTDNYKAISLKGKIKQMVDSSESLTMSNELSFIRSVDEGSEDKFNVSSRFSRSDKDKSIINTEDNLNHKIFESLVNIVGVGEKSCLVTKKAYIDEKLLSNRNKIAHGNKVDGFTDEFDLDIGSIKSIKNLVFSVIDSLAADLKYYAENQYYLSCKNPEKDEYNIHSNRSLESEIAEIAI